jgi:hypothetical protein
VRHWNFAFQKGFAKASGQASRPVGRQGAEQRTPGGHPGKRFLQHPDRQVALAELPDHECRERPVGFEIGAEQDSTGVDSRNPQDLLEQARRRVQHGDRLAHERQHGGQALEGLRVPWHREVARPSPRGDPKLGQVHRQPFLQLARAAGSDQGRPRRAATDVDEEARAIRLRARAGKGGCRGPRSARRTESGNEDDLPAHRPAGLA